MESWFNIRNSSQMDLRKFIDIDRSEDPVFAAHFTSDAPSRCCASIIAIVYGQFEKRRRRVYANKCRFFHCHSAGSRVLSDAPHRHRRVVLHPAAILNKNITGMRRKMIGKWSDAGRSLTRDRLHPFSLPSFRTSRSIPRSLVWNNYFTFRPVISLLPAKRD